MFLSKKSKKKPILVKGVNEVVELHPNKHIFRDPWFVFFIGLFLTSHWLSNIRRTPHHFLSVNEGRKKLYKMLYLECHNINNIVVSR